MSVPVQPNSTSDTVWDHIQIAHKYNARMRAMHGYKELSERDGQYQKHYREMYEYLRDLVDQSDLKFLDAEYEWHRAGGALHLRLKAGGAA